MQKNLEDIKWTIDEEEFDDFFEQQRKNLPPGPDGIPCGIHRCAGGSGSPILFKAHTYVVEGGSVHTHILAASRTVFIPKSSIVDDKGLIGRSPDALDCKIITTAICCGLHKHSNRCYYTAQRCVSAKK